MEYQRIVDENWTSSEGGEQNYTGVQLIVRLLKMHIFLQQAKRILYKRKSLNKYEREYILHLIYCKISKES